MDFQTALKQYRDAREVSGDGYITEETAKRFLYHNGEKVRVIFGTYSLTSFRYIFSEAAYDAIRPVALSNLKTLVADK